MSDNSKGKKRNAVYDTLKASVSVFSEGKIELYGNREAVVDGCRGVLEYDETTIKLNMGKSRITFSGSGMLIRAYDKDHAEIEGSFSSVEFN